MSSTLEGKHAVVTGGTGALGRAVVGAFLDAGAIVHVPHLELAPPGGLPASERLHLQGGLDLTDEGQVQRFYGALPELWASVQAAGGFAMAPFADTSLADFRAQMDMNLTSCFLCCREAVRRMQGTPGGAGGGRIVNVSSRAAMQLAGGSIGYTVSKAGVVALTQALADEVKKSGILVNAVLPSIIDTPANRKAMSPSAEVAARWPKPAEVAAAILWLASPDNRLTSGAAVPVYGRA
jgi:NAD(P)-dependent dehydrogenase (short-subunit alcohol dehydrogenase family)